MTRVADFHALLGERPDGFELFAGIIDTEQIDFLRREGIFRKSTNHQCLILRGKTSKDDQRVILLENGRFAFSKALRCKGFSAPNRVSNQTFCC